MNISPIDNRYNKITEPLNIYVSDFGMNKLRCTIEIEYFIFILNKLFNIDSTNSALQNIYKNFNMSDLENIREKEKVTNHDIKALEYFIIEKIENFENQNDLELYNNYSNYVHFLLHHKILIV